MKIRLKWWICLAMWGILWGQSALASDALQNIHLFAHRGLSLQHPENSVAAVHAAMDSGFHGSEIDLRTTRDGVIILMHDETLDRTTTATGRVSGHAIAQIRNFRLRDAHGVPTRHKIAELSQVLALVQTQPEFQLALDLKAVDAHAVVKQVEAHGLQASTIFCIASPLDLAVARQIKSLNPALKISVDLLSWWKIEDLPTFVIKALDADVVFASEWFFPQHGFIEAQAAGAQVHVLLWGEEDLPRRLKRAVSLGAQVISCDRPDLLLPLLTPRKQDK